MFSPYYAWSGRAAPEDHCALNVALYGPREGLWAMTERGAAHLRRDMTTLAIGPSALSWGGDGLTIRIDEHTAPTPPLPTAPQPLRGTIRVRPDALNPRAFPLDAAARHLWRPIAPRARIEAVFEAPGVSWSGDGYFDTNVGVEPLEDAFDAWDWSRAHLRRDAAVIYDLKRRDGSELCLALRFDPSGQVEARPAPERSPLPGTLWRVARCARADAGRQAHARRTWEDTPFYARTALTTHLFGEPAEGVHESLSLSRLRSPWVRRLLPFRMPRALR